MNICELLENNNAKSNLNDDEVVLEENKAFIEIKQELEFENKYYSYDDNQHIENKDSKEITTAVNTQSNLIYFQTNEDSDKKVNDLNINETSNASVKMHITESNQNNSNEEDNVDYNRDNSNDSKVDFNLTENNINQTTSSNTNEKLNNQQLNYLLNSSIFSSSNDITDDTTQIQNNNTYGHTVLSSSVEDEYTFDRLGPLEKLCCLCDNPTPSNMESASKYLVPALEFCNTQEDFKRVFSYLRKYCFFSDVLLRSLWLEQIQNIIQYLHQEIENMPAELKNNFNMPNEIALLISDLMQEPTYQVKKYATASLLCIVERQLLNNDQIEKIIIPSLLNLVKENNEDFHIDCISLFGKLAPLVGRELTTKYFLEPFCRLSTSPVFHTRKACASNITEMANVVSTEEVEKYLIPHFCEFMKDQVWAIRKVCADIFSIFAIKCKRKTREKELTDYFIRLLDDNSRWVKISAYKSLGSFIATFSKSNSDNIEEEQMVKTNNISADLTNINSEQEKKESEYSNFIYWRNSLPSLEDTATTNSLNDGPIKESKEQNSLSKTDNNKSYTTDQFAQINLTNAPFNTSYLSSLYSSTSSLYSNSQQQVSSKTTDVTHLSSELKQDIVPPILLSYFITMIDMNAQNSLDAEMNYNCAFNFPAIALTLGVNNWKYVKNLYKKLAEDNNWKVRQTLAYSIHELASILGTDCTQAELVPVFDSFIKDVDEVRMGIVANLSKFFKILSINYRRAYMPKLNDFLKMDNQRNWRFRNELGLQITEFSELFPVECIAEYIQPVTFILALDKVAEVRLTAIKALTVILKQYESSMDTIYRENFVNDVIRTFANNPKWSFRQLYVFFCENILKEKAYVHLESLCTDLLPKMLSLRYDNVPNIRVCLARVISNYIIKLDYFINSNQPIINELKLTIEFLNKDKEYDVRTHFIPSNKLNDSNKLPPYDEVLKYISKSKISNNINDFTKKEYNFNEDQSNKLETNNSDRLNDSLILINNNKIVNFDINEKKEEKLNDNDNNVDYDDEDDDDDEDEVIESTKINQLKIVHDLDNDIDDVDENFDYFDKSRISNTSDTININLDKTNISKNNNNEKPNIKESTS